MPFCDVNPADVLALLRELEWYYYKPGYECPICHGLRPSHEQACRLATMIAAMGESQHTTPVQEP